MIYSIIGIVCVIASLILVTSNKISSSFHTYLIYVSTLFITYSTTMVGLSVVGSDISRELLMSNLALENGWDLTIYDPSNTSVLVGFVIPYLSKITTLQPIWIYKAILPLVFALTPVIMYRIFKPMIGELKSFYACMFFAIMPILNLEVATIGKSMVAEPIMVLAIWVSVLNFSALKKCFMLSVLTVLALWVHYTIGLILCIYLCAFFGWHLLKLGVDLVRRKEVKVLTERGKNAGVMATVLVLAGVFFLSYYYCVAGGLLYNNVVGILFKHDYSHPSAIIKDSVSHIATQNTQTSEVVVETVGADIVISSDNNSAAYGSTIIAGTTNPDIPKPDVPKRLDPTVAAYSLILSALGLDMFNVSPSGMVFRIVQLITQGLVVIGFAWMLWKRKLYKFKEEYLVGCSVAFGLLGLCVAVPAFASLINATRQYHMALLFLAPCFVLAFDGIEHVGMTLKTVIGNKTRKVV